MVKFEKFQCPSQGEFPKFSGTPLTFDPYVILKEVIANQSSIFGRPVLRWGTVIPILDFGYLFSLYSITYNSHEEVSAAYEGWQYGRSPQTSQSVPF